VIRKRLPWIGLIAGLVLLVSAQGFSQAPYVQDRIPQQVVINGQQVSAVHVVAPGGGMQTYTCSNPQAYTTPEGTAQGWACFDQSAGVWLLNALPPAEQPVAQAPAPVQQPPAGVQQPATVVYPPAGVQQPATVVYPPAGVQQPATVVYPPATVVYAPPAPVVVAPVYPASVVLGTAAIEATGRIVSAAIWNSRYPRYYVVHGHPRW
jgi:hypothetical protein